MSTGRGTLAGRIALVTTAVAVVAVLVAGLVSVGFVRSAGDTDARRTLATLADAAADSATGTGRLGGVALAKQRTRNQLNALKIDFTLLTRTGATSGGPAGGLAVRALTDQERAAVVAGEPLSLTRDVGGTRTLVEARPVANGGVVLAQALSDASVVRGALGRIALALLIGLAVAVLAGVLLARLLARPLKDAAHTAHLLAAGARDVRVPPAGPAEVAAVADSLNVLSAALATSEGRQREFLLSVSHELRTPLTAITGFAESLADGVTTGADVRPVGETVLGEARRLDRLVSDLLDLARLGAQDFRIDLQAVDLTELLGKAADVWRARCEAVGVQAGTDLPRHPVHCVTDPTRVRQIVDGLAENALRVTPAGRPVVLALYETPGAAVLQVRDGG
ncbi:MAG TPA: HAMP domain-containing sensor histidine kinase, partial [Mycobacteriales bacterium]|nr:HAMP domain-containing sensor histidine kinase [Mycobacteriales bacterium]